jgi:hypothetical protein
MQVRISSLSIGILKCSGSPHHRKKIQSKKKGALQKAFYIGGNSTCHVHIRHHYNVYKKQCKEKKIPENHHTIPRPLWRQMQDKKKNTRGNTQTKLDGVIDVINWLQIFMREGVLHAVAQFIACDDQV